MQQNVLEQFCSIENSTMGEIIFAPCNKVALGHYVAISDLKI